MATPPSYSSSLSSVVLDYDTVHSSVSLVTSNKTGIFVDENQNIGINTDTITNKLSLYCAPNDGIYISNTSSANTSFILDNNGYLNINGSGTYVKINPSLNIVNHNGITTGLFLSGTLVAASATELNYLSGITVGTASASKAIVLNSSSEISGIVSLSATNLTGTLQTSTQTNITSIGTLTSLSSSGSVTFTSGTSSSSTTTGTLVVTGGVGISGNLHVGGNIVGTISIASLTLSGTTDASSSSNGGTFTSNGGGAFNKSVYIGNNLILSGSTSILNLSGANGQITITNNASSTSSTTGSIQCSGGIYIGADSLIAGSLTSSLTTASTSNTIGSVLLAGGIAINNSTDATSSTNGGTFTSAGGGAFAKSLYVGNNLIVGGNLTISGTTTQIDSTTVNISDNIIVLNSGPAGTGFDSGFLTQRYQTDNITGDGDVVNDTPKATATLISATSNTITLPTSLSNGTTSSVNNYYNGWWVKITSGTASNNVRQITGYVGSTRVATLDTSFTSTPSTDTIELYNKNYSSMIWQAATNRFVAAFTSQNIYSSQYPILDYTDFQCNNQIISASTTSSSSSTGALIVTGGVGIGGTINVGGSINGTIGTASQTNITSIGTLTSLSSSGTVTFTSGTTSSSTSTGTLVVTGGTGISENLYVGGLINGTINTASQSNITSIGILTSLSSSGLVSFTSGTASSNTTTGTLVITGGIGISGAINTGGNLTISGSLSGVTTLAASGIISLSNSTVSSSTTTGALTVAGGVGIGDKLYVGNGIYGILQTASQTNITTVGTLTTLSSSASTVTFTSSTVSSSISTGTLVITGGVGIGGDINTGGNLTISGSLSGVTTINASNIVTFTNNTSSSTSSTGALVVTGGVGIGGSLYVGGSINGTIGTSSQPNITAIGTLTSLSSSGAVTFTAGTVSSSTSTGSLVVTGGVGISGSLYVGDSINGTINTAAQTNITSIGILTSLSSSGIVTFTSATASTTSTNGSLVVTGGVGIGGSINTNGNLSISGSLSGITTLGASGIATLSNTTASVSALSGALVVNGGVGIGKNIFIGGTSMSAPFWGVGGIQCSILSTTITDTSSTTGTISTINAINSFSRPTISASNTGIVYTTSSTVYIANSPLAGTNVTLTNSYALYIAAGNTFINTATQSTSSSTGALVVAGGVGIGGNIYTGGNICLNNTSTSYSLDFGTLGTPPNMQINLYGGTRGLGSANNALQYFSDSSHTWFTSASAITGTGASGATQLATLTNGGYFYIGPSGTTPQYPIHVTTNYSSSTYTNPAYQYTNTILGSHGNLTSFGLVSIFATYQMVAAAFITTSDRRIKTNISYLDDDYCSNFIKLAKPVTYNLKHDLDNNIDNKQCGFIAQDLIKSGYGNLVTAVNEDNEYLVETTDEEGFTSLQNVKLTVSYTDIIPILTKSIQTLTDEKEELSDRVLKLEKINKLLFDRLDRLEHLISKH
jgi:hypothetical protein